MRKLTIVSLILLALILSGCNMPGYESTAPQDADNAMATEISKILTGTPVELEEVLPEVEDEVEATLPPEVEPTQDQEAEATEEELEAEETEAPEPTETPTPTPTAELAETDPARTLGDPDWVDSMDDGDNWFIGSDTYSSAVIDQGYLKLTSKTVYNGWRLTWPYLTDFYLQAKIQTPDCQGSGHYGLMFRVPNVANSNQGYLFGVSCDGRYILKIWDNPAMQYLFDWTASDAIITGEGAVNTLGVLAKESALSFYINGEKVKELTNNAFLEGGFGVFVGENSENLTIWVDDIKYWENP